MSGAGEAWQGAGMSRATAGHLSNSMGDEPGVIQTAAGKKTQQRPRFFDAGERLAALPRDVGGESRTLAANAAVPRDTALVVLPPKSRKRKTD